MSFFYLFTFKSQQTPPKTVMFPFPLIDLNKFNLCFYLIIYIINHAPADGKTKKINPEGAPLDEPLWKKNYVIYYKPPKKNSLESVLIRWG